MDPNTGKIFAVAVGSPNDEGYARACDDAYQAIYLAGQTEVFKEEEVSHRRGQFPALNVGVSYGHGPDRPHNLKMYKHEKTLRSLLQNPGIVRMANFASSEFVSGICASCIFFLTAIQARSKHGLRVCSSIIGYAPRPCLIGCLPWSATSVEAFTPARLSISALKSQRTPIAIA